MMARKFGETKAAKSFARSSAKFSKAAVARPKRKPKARPKPSAAALRAMERLADENRIPQSWIDSSDDPTKPESPQE
ncbi:MAG TPA: hypothetical protein VH253_14010 [Phycisphaerae bacterium]|nr:hypothetical protein [Phycisphaerae bacterium]